MKGKGMPKGLATAVIFSVCLVAFLGGGPEAQGAVYNVKVLSDKVCDLTDLPNFVYSATSRWTTNETRSR